MVRAPELLVGPMEHCDVCGALVPGFDALDHFWAHRSASYMPHGDALTYESPLVSDGAPGAVEMRHDWAFDHRDAREPAAQLQHIDMNAWPHWAAVRLLCLLRR